MTGIFAGFLAGYLGIGGEGYLPVSLRVILALVADWFWCRC